MKAKSASAAERRRGRDGLGAATTGWSVGWSACLLGAFCVACRDDARPPAAASGRGFVAVDGGSTPAAGGTVEQRPERGPRLPYADEEVTLVPGETVRVLLVLDAGVGALDVHLSIDTTQSMAGAIDALQRGLRDDVVVGLAERVPDVAFGVSRFEDFPLAPFGSSGEGMQRPDTPFGLLCPITTDLERVAAAVAALDQPLGLGGDGPESSAEALWQIATGEGYVRSGTTLVESFEPERSLAAPGDVGGVGFRAGALPVVLHVTDAPSHEPGDYDPHFPGTHTLGDAIAALDAIGGRLVGIAANGCSDRRCPKDARAELERVAHATGAFVEPNDQDACPHGVGGAAVQTYEDVCPLVFDVDENGTGLSGTLVDAIAALVDGIRYAEVHGVASDDPLGFVDRIEPVVPEDSAGEETPEVADLSPSEDPDGVLDAFVDVRAETELAFEVWLRNVNVAPTDEEQRFRVVVRILGDGIVVQERTLRLVVPAADALGQDPALGEADAG